MILTCLQKVPNPKSCLQKVPNPKPLKPYTQHRPLSTSPQLTGSVLWDGCASEFRRWPTGFGRRYTSCGNFAHASAHSVTKHRCLAAAQLWHRASTLFYTLQPQR